MRIIALLSFYDEAPDVLSECIAALAVRGDIDHLVAVDGVYRTYPHESPVSPVEQHAAVMVAARRHNIPLTFHVPSVAWGGGEVEKRTALFKIGLSVAERGDWFWVQDADQFVREAPGLKERLAATDHDVATIRLHDRVIERIPFDQRAPGMVEDFQMRALFRAQPITVAVNHYTYVTDDGRVLWGGSAPGQGMVEALDMQDVIVDHCPDRRTAQRQQGKHAYYIDRDARGLELGDCMVCQSPRRARSKVPSDLRIVVLGGRRVPAGTWIEVCGYHGRRQSEANDRFLKSHGMNPKGGVFENRNGRIEELEVVAA